jgi:PAS domain S-box-containing protein
MEEASSRILALLKFHPKGLSISKISSRLKINRNSIAKYLDVLQATGKVENRILGQAKVYYLTRRVPASALLNLSSALVCTLDEEHRILYANDSFLEFFGFQAADILGHDPEEIPQGIPVTPSLTEIICSLSMYTESDKEIALHKKEDYWFRIREIPTVFEDGSRGTTLFMEDRTQEQLYVHNLEFLARTSAELANMGDEVNIYQYIVDRVAELVPESIVTVNSIDLDTRISTCEAMGGENGLHERVFQDLGVKIIGSSLQIDMAPEALPVLQSNTLLEGPGRLYVETYRMFPEEVCDRIDYRYSLGRDFTMGCVCRGGLYGNVTIRLKKGQELRNRETIEAFIRQAGVALQRRHMREKVRRLEEQLKQQ